MRVAIAIALSEESRLRLEKLARGRSTPVRIVQRNQDRRGTDEQREPGARSSPPSGA